MKKTLCLILLFLLLSTSAFAAGVDASSATVRIYKAYASPNGDCSSPVVFFNAETDTANYPNGYAEVDMVADPTIGSGSLEDGTYNCIIFKMSDQITFVPATTDGNCVAETVTPQDICWDASMRTKNAETGVESSCANGVEDMVWVYISIYSTSTTGGIVGDTVVQAFLPPTSDGDGENGIKLDGAMTVASDLTGTFVFGTDGKVTSQADSCELTNPGFAFRTATQ